MNNEDIENINLSSLYFTGIVIFTDYFHINLLGYYGIQVIGGQYDGNILLSVYISCTDDNLNHRYNVKVLDKAFRLVWHLLTC